MIGVDVVSIERIQVKDSFIKMILTKEELQEYTNLQTEKQKQYFLASHFAAKEAIYKATNDPNYLSYTILHHENGAPYVLNHPEILISISHDAGVAIAMVLIQSR